MADDRKEFNCVMAKAEDQHGILGMGGFCIVLWLSDATLLTCFSNLSFGDGC